MSDDDQDLPRGFFARSRELAGLGARLAGKELSQRLGSALKGSDRIQKLKTQVDQARVLVDSLGKLKGAAMKVGQMMSIEGVDFLPPEVVEILGQLQDNAATMPLATVERILHEEWGADRRRLLDDLSPQPLASASIGQSTEPDTKIGTSS